MSEKKITFSFNYCTRSTMHTFDDTKGQIDELTFLKFLSSLATPEVRCSKHLQQNRRSLNPSHLNINISCIINLTIDALTNGDM